MTERSPHWTTSPVSPVGSPLTRTLTTLFTAFALAGALTALRPQLPGAVLAAQEAGTIAGIVNAAGTHEPLVGAQIIVVGGTERATSDERGRFRLTGLTGAVGSPLTIEVRRIGYHESRIPTRIGETNLGVELAANPASLEAVVVTGTPGATEKREIGNAVSTVNAAEVTQIAPVTNMQQLLNGRAPGVVILPTSGAVGTGSQVRVRGDASFSLGNNPLLYVDGVRVNNSAASGPASQSFGSSPISRLNDFNPEDIESIEVLKGPSAATLYGTEASNGVINIITKKGTTGAPRWNFIARQGVNYLQDWRTRFPTNYGPAGGNGAVVALSMDSLLKANEGDLFRNGRHQETELSVSGGSGIFNYYASGNLLDSQGAEPSNNVRKYTGRLNLGVSPSPKFSVSSDMGFITGPTYLSAEAGFGGRVWTTLLATPKTYGTWQHGFYSSLPWQYDEVYHMWQDLDRFTGSVRFEHRPTTWFQHRLTLGLDRTREGNNYYQPRIDSLTTIPSIGSDALGYRETDQVSTTYRSVDYAASATWNANSAMRFVTSAGAQYYHTLGDTLDAWGSVFPTPGLSAIFATTQSPGEYGNSAEFATLGYYGQEEFAWRDQLFLTAALRWDNSSAFGQNINRVVYPKYSASWVLSDVGFWRNQSMLSRLNSFRLRAAYGEAGKAPGTYDALRTYSPASGPADAPAVTPLSLGNPNLGPERGKEYELGFDAGALDDRIGLEATYYHKKTTDAILFRQLAPSVGFSSIQPFNAGSILNKGFELALHGAAYRSERVTWDLNASISTNNNKVLSLLQGTDSVLAALYSTAPSVWHKVGFPAFSFFGPRVVAASVDPTGKTIVSSVLCDDGKGGTTPCYNTAGTSVVAPRVFLGTSVPKYEGSFSTTLSFLRDFRIYTQIDYSGGNKKIDGNTRVRCFFFGGRCAENFMPTQADPVRVAQVQSNGLLTNMLVDDASFAKWREFTIAYNIPDRFMRMANVSRASISVSGRNLHTWTNYKGFEPEAMFLGGSRGGNIPFEQTILPQLTSWIVTLNLGM
jgi:TonB-dependent SusC/RagA subfamily outer membrane receptor